MSKERLISAPTSDVWRERAEELVRDHLFMRNLEYKIVGWAQEDSGYYKWLKERPERQYPAPGFAAGFWIGVIVACTYMTGALLVFRYINKEALSQCKL